MVKIQVVTGGGGGLVDLRGGSNDSFTASPLRNPAEFLEGYTFSWIKRYIHSS